jgi:preprotein translocase subunit SecF
MASLPNIYKHKNLKFLIAVPLVLLVLGALFSTQIVLDTSLRGGVSIIIQTNTTLGAGTLAGDISSALHVQASEIATSPGGLQITLPINQSLANANSYLIQFYADKSNYSAYLVNATSLSIAYGQNKTPALLPQIQQANANINASLQKMQLALKNEITALQPFGAQVNSTINSTDPNVLQNSAQSAYSTASSVYQANVIATLHRLIPFTSYSYQQVTPTLGQFFLGELANTIIVAFVLVFFVVLFIFHSDLSFSITYVRVAVFVAALALVLVAVPHLLSSLSIAPFTLVLMVVVSAIVVFLSPIPSMAVVFGAANDIIIALGAMGLFKIPLGVASVAGLLMLIGYSIDTDVLTAIRILRRGEGTPEERAYSAMRTGVTMTATAIVSFGVLFVVSLIAYVPTYYEIAGVVLFGLIGDIATTWLGNASMILMYKKRKEGTR